MYNIQHIPERMINMAGMQCPKCKKLTFFKTTGDSRKCSNCGDEMNVPPNGGKGGRGKKCLNCGKMTVFKNKCETCGAEYRMPKTPKA